MTAPLQYVRTDWPNLYNYDNSTFSVISVFQTSTMNIYDWSFFDFGYASNDEESLPSLADQSLLEDNT